MHTYTKSNSKALSMKLYCYILNNSSGMYAVISYVRHCIDQYVLLILAVHGDQENQYGFLRLESKGQHAIKCLMNANLQVQKSFYKAIT
jgi:hypothetical protein